MRRALLVLGVLALVIQPAIAAAAAPAAPSAKRMVIIDQDAFGPAGSNMQAILMLLQSKDVELLGITIPSGDGWRDEEVSHALRLLEVAHRTEIPVYPGAVYPILNTQARNKLWESLYGTLFYKGAWTEVWPDEGTSRRTPYHADPYFIPPAAAGEPKIKPAKENAANFLVRKVHEFPGKVTVIAAGPMTNLALASRLDPEFASLAQELVFMGGSFNPTAADNAFAGEYENAPRREFNMRWDPEAASIVLHQPWKKITEVPIDPTTRTFFRPELLHEVGTGQAPFAGYLREFGQSYPMWDELAVAVWLDPSIATRTKTLLVDVDTSFSAAYGTTVSWSPQEGPGLGERQVNVVFEADVPKLEHLAVELLKAPTPAHSP
jgi:purine nucleosidase